MKKISLTLPMGNDTTETRTGYFIPNWDGIRFVVVRDDTCGQKTWSVSQYDTGLKAGMVSSTRKGAITAFQSRLQQLVKQFGEDHMKTSVRRVIGEYPVLNPST